MTTTTNTSDRHLIPRWRSFHNAVSQDELTFLQADTQRKLDQGLDKAERDWYEYRTAVYAAEFAGAAIIAGMPERAESTVPLLRATGGLNQELGDTLASYLTSVRRTPWAYKISENRRLLLRDPRNAIAWVDLSRVQLSHGHISSAQKSMDIALHLAPQNRFVLRAAATLYADIDDPYRAVSILTPVASISNDPWLIAAEIALSSLAKVRSKLIIKGRSQLDAGDWDQLSISELASEIATLEAQAGKDKKAKKLFRKSLDEPTENAVAQATFISANIPELVTYDIHNLLIERTHQARCAYEAHALQAEIESKFMSAKNHALKWLDDQPFSPRAAIYVSYIAASALEDWECAEKAAKHGLSIHSNDTALLNNYAYALIESNNNLTDARQLINRAEKSKDALTFAAPIAATKGLLEYRSGNIYEGYRLYNYAAAIAHKNRKLDIEGYCTCNARP